MIRNSYDQHRLYTSMSQLFSYKRSPFTYGQYPAGVKVGPHFIARNDLGLAAVYEKHSNQKAFQPAQNSVYQHPQIGSSQKNSPVYKARDNFNDWYKSLGEGSKSYFESFQKDLKKQNTSITDQEKQKMQKQLNQWLSDNHLTKRLEEAPSVVAKKLLPTADKILDDTGKKLWSNMEKEIARHNDSIKPGEKPPINSGDDLKKALHELKDWNKSLKKDSKDFVEDFEEELKNHAGRYTDDDLVSMRDRLNGWLDDHRDNLVDKLDGLPAILKEVVLQLADRRLDRIEDKVWKQITEAVKQHNDGIPPVDPPENPFEKAERIYSEWNQSLGELSKDYLESINKNLDQLAGTVSDEMKQEMENQLFQWLSDQRDQLEKQLNELPHGIVKQILKNADKNLDSLNDSLWNTIEDKVNLHNNLINQAQQAHTGWNDTLDDLSKEYFDSFKENLGKMTGAVTDEQKLQMQQGLYQWIKDQHDDLADLLMGTPSGYRKHLLEEASKNLDSLSDRLWKSMEEEIRKHNLSIPPIVTPPVPLPPGTVFKPGENIKIEVKAGERKAALMLQDINSKNRGKTMFYVIDAYGNRKAVSITFNNERLQQEFEKRFKESSMYGKNISLEKFNRFLDKIKKSLNEFNESDMERLKSKVLEKEQSTKLDTLVNDFAGLLKKMKV